MEIVEVRGDLLEQPVECIVNAWNMNVIPWWLLLPHGVSGAIKRRGGLQPFKEVGKYGPLKLGQAVLTSAGKLPFKHIIHVAAINLLWTATERSIGDSTRNAVQLAVDSDMKSLAFPILGTGAGGFDLRRAKAIMRAALDESDATLSVVLVEFAG